MSEPTLYPATLLLSEAERYGARQLGPAYRTSSPIPLGKDLEQARYAFLLARAEVVVAGNPPSLFPPAAVITLRAVDGLVLELRSTTPADFELDVDADAPLGFEPPPHVRLSDEHRAARHAVCEAIDALAPAFFGVASLDEAALDDDALDARIDDYLGALESTGEGPLLPFERSLGRRFFSWIASHRERDR
ncbi:MAG: hypothetical protein AB7S26_19310 [Sandaracinaceae bacterium]